MAGRDVFICHAHLDKVAYVRPLSEALDQRGISCWIDEAQILPGESIVGKINDGLRSSRIVLVIITDAFVERNWPEKELNSALSRESGPAKFWWFRCCAPNPAGISIAIRCSRTSCTSIGAKGPGHSPITLPHSSRELPHPSGTTAIPPITSGWSGSGCFRSPRTLVSHIGLHCAGALTSKPFS